MRVTPVRTDRIAPGTKTLIEILDNHLSTMEERSVLAVASKIVSLCENRVVAADEIESKNALVERECDRYVTPVGRHGFQFTITHNTLIPAAGIDESNVGGGYLLWPADPQRTANEVRAYVSERFAVSDVGVVITDSTCTPLRRGTSGISIAHSGFESVNDYVGSPDLFGRPFQVSQANIAGGLAAAAELAMGEGAEQTPLCVIDDLPAVRFQRRDPTPDELHWLAIAAEDDLFEPFLVSVEWKTGSNFATYSARPK